MSGGVIVTVYVAIDDVMRTLGPPQRPLGNWSGAEVLTVAVVAGLSFQNHHDRLAPESGLHADGGAGAAPEESVRLRFFTIDLPTDEARRAVLSRLDAAAIPHAEADGVVTVRDPWQNVILLQVVQVAGDQAAGLAPGQAGVR